MEHGLPGFDVLTFQLISFKTSTRLFLAADVPTAGRDHSEVHVQQNETLKEKKVQQEARRSPVAFAKLRLQEANAIPRTGNFLLQPVESIDHYNTEAVQIKYMSKKTKSD